MLPFWKLENNAMSGWGSPAPGSMARLAEGRQDFSHHLLTSVGPSWHHAQAYTVALILPIIFQSNTMTLLFCNIQYTENMQICSLWVLNRCFGWLIIQNWPDMENSILQVVTYSYSSSDHPCINLRIPFINSIDASWALTVWKVAGTSKYLLTIC